MEWTGILFSLLLAFTFSRPGHARTETWLPPGSHLNAAGEAIFRTYSENATHIEICFYRKALGAPEAVCVPLHRVAEGGLWMTSVDEVWIRQNGLNPDELYYGFRAWGPNWPYDPAWTPGSAAGFLEDVDSGGNRFNPNKLLLDPYALEISHGLESVSDLDVFLSGPENRTRDSGPAAPKSLLLTPPGLGPAAPLPPRPFKDEVIAEAHVRGLTLNDPSVPAELRGTYKGAALKAAYLRDLGVTAIEFLPVQQKVSARHQPNYWGYMSLGYFAPERSYAHDQSPGGPTREFRAMVEEFHRHGIKVYIDVVYNHTGEGGAAGLRGAKAPLYSLRGLDNALYYDLAQDRCHYHDNTGCGNNLAVFREPVRELIVDSLKHWRELGVDGYRFDLASVLGNSPRHGHFHFDASESAGLLRRIPAELPGADLIAEPWAIGPGTYQTGNFPPGWAEWNGPYRDTMRGFFNRRGHEPVPVGELANALSGSARPFAVSPESRTRGPAASVNFITAHDGFTLLDLFRFNHKNNHQLWPYGPSDGGEDHNRSWDQGGDPVMQKQMVRTALASLLLSAGVPMVVLGDENHRTLNGNNNPYNLDTIANAIDWSKLNEDPNLHDFVRFLLAFRRAHPELRPAEFFKGEDRNGNGLKDLAWYTAGGREMRSEEFHQAGDFLAYRIDTSALSAESGIRSLYFALNAGFTHQKVELPPASPGYEWHRVADTAAWFEAHANFHPAGHEQPVGADYDMHARCALLLVEKAPTAGPTSALSRR